MPQLDPIDRALVRSQRSNRKQPIPHATSLCRIPILSVRVFLLRRFWCAVAGVAWHRGARVLGHRGICWRVVRRGSAGTQEQGCPTTYVSKISPGQEQTSWKWSLTFCLSFTAHSWPWTPRWSALSRADGAPRRQCAERDGASLDQTRRTKERTCPELTGEHGRARVVVFA